MQRANQENRQASANTFARQRPLRGALLALSASLGVTFFLSACGSSGGSHADKSGSGDPAGGSGSVGSADVADGEFDPDTVVAAAEKAAAMSEDDLSAALAALDLDNEMALAQRSGLVTELGTEMIARFAWAGIGTQAKIVTEAFRSGTLFDSTQQPLSAPNIMWPGVHTQADGGGTVGEAFGAGWLGGSLFNAVFVDTAISGYVEGETGFSNSMATEDDVLATATISDTKVTLDATLNFNLANLSATIKTHSAIPCPDSTGLMTIDSYLDVTGKAGSAQQSARFTFELLVDVDDDAHLTGRSELTSSTKTHTSNSKNGYKATDQAADVTITEFPDGSFGNAKSTFIGMTEDESIRWMNAGVLSGSLYRDHLLPNLQKMLDAGRCVDVTVEPSAGPLDLEPLTKVDLLAKPRAKSTNSGVSTEGTVKATFKVNAGGTIAEAGDKVPADATFHYVAPSEHSATEVVTFEARSKRGTGKLDYKLTTSPHAD